MKEHGLKRFRILVADDDSSILDLFQQVLSRVETDHMVPPEVEELQFDIETCQQGDEAVDAVKSSLKEGRPFSVAFIDIRMPPGPDGIRAAEHIRALDPNIEIVIVTGYSDTHPRDITRRVPPAHKLLYLQKPFHSQEIYQFASALSMKWHTEFELRRINKGLEKSVEARIQEIGRSERRFKNFLANLGDVAYETDSSGMVTYANKMAEILLGVPLKDIISKPFFPMLTEESQAMAMDAHQRGLKGEGLEFDLTFTNGRICRCKNKPLRDEDGKIVGVFGIARDITDRKRGEIALRESEERYRAVVESQTEMICRFFPDGTLTFVNDAYCHYFDKDRKELIGHKFAPLIPESDRDKVLENIASLNPNTPVITLEHRVLAPNGEICWQKWTNRAIFDEKSNLVEYQAVGWDITDRVRAEEALRESEERFRMIFTKSTDGIIVTDPETKKFINFNPAICKALGYTEEELTQMSVVDIHPKNSLEYVVSEFEAQARGEKLLAMNIPFLKKDGTIIYMDSNASIVKMGEKHRIMGVFRDITDRKRTEEALRKAHDELEGQVEDRTRKLRTTLKTMRRKEEEIMQHKSSLEKLNREIIETNQALSVLARNIDRDKEFLEKKIYETTSVNIMPIIKELQKDTNCQKHQADLELLTTYLNSLVPGPAGHHEVIISLTDQEMRVAVMVKNGLTSQKIADILHISLHTVKTHRKNIRKKLDIHNSTVNLASYLKSKMVSDSM